MARPVSGAHDAAPHLAGGAAALPARLQVILLGMLCLVVSSNNIGNNFVLQVIVEFSSYISAFTLIF